MWMTKIHFSILIRLTFHLRSIHSIYKTRRIHVGVLIMCVIYAYYPRDYKDNIIGDELFLNFGAKFQR